MCHAINNFNLQNSIFINKSKPINTLFCFTFPQKRPVDSTSYAIPLNLCDYHFSLALYAYKLKRFVGIHLLSVCTSPSVVSFRHCVNQIVSSCRTQNWPSDWVKLKSLPGHTVKSKIHIVSNKFLMKSLRAEAMNCR